MIGGLKFPLKEHKTLAEFKNNDFNADKPRHTSIIWRKTRVQTCIRKSEIFRQNFFQAVVEGRRSGSGIIVSEFYDKLVQLWGGFACAKPLAFDQQSNCIGNVSNNAGLNDTYPDSGDESDMRTYPANIYLLKVNSRNVRKRCQIFSKLKVKTPERRHWRKKQKPLQ